MEFYHDPENRIGIMRPKGATVVITVPPEAAKELQKLLERKLILGDHGAMHSLAIGLRQVLQSTDNTQRLDPAFAGPADEHAGTWSASTPEALRVLRKGQPTEPGHALGSREVGRG